MYLDTDKNTFWPVFLMRETYSLLLYLTATEYTLRRVLKIVYNFLSVCFFVFFFLYLAHVVTGTS